MMQNDLQDKNSHSVYLTNEAMQLADELSKMLGVPGRSAIFEMSIRAMHKARNAHTYQIAYDEALADVKKELGVSPYDSTE